MSIFPSVHQYIVASLVFFPISLVELPSVSVEWQTLPQTLTAAHGLNAFVWKERQRRW